MSDFENQQDSKDENGEEIIIKHKKTSLKQKFYDLKERIKIFFENPKKRLIFIICLGVVVIVAFGIGLYFMTKEKPSAQNKTIKKAVDTSEDLVPAPLDGIEVDQATANKHPLAVMIENHPAARPQSGLNRASVVYEALAEGGITRFMAIFGTYEADKIGPIRSARPYYVDWAEGYNAFYAHVGGNIDALDQIKADGVFDLNQFAFPAPYWRETNLGVSSEHTMFSSTIGLREQATKNKYTEANDFTIYKFSEKPANDPQKKQATSITVDFSNPSYLVKFQYDPKTNNYLRFLAGKAHTDRTTNNTLAPKNIVVMTVSRSAYKTRINESGWKMTTIGEGAAKIFMNGNQIDGKWVKKSKTSREVFYDSSGKEIVFNRGQLWICVIPPDSSVSVTN